jgi:Flp pilus assembly protein TadD
MTLRTYGQLPLSTKGAPPVTARQKSWFWLRMMTLIVFIGLLLARVKGSFIALVGVAVFLAVVFLLPVGRELFQRNKRYVLVCLGVLVVGGAAYLVRHGGFEAFGSKQVTVQQRIENYQVAWEMLKDHFGLGVGLGQVGVQYAVYQSKPYPASEYPQHPVIQSTHIHNDFLQYAVEGGVVGLALFLLVLGTFAWSVFRSFKSPELGKEEKELLVGVLAGMVGLLVQSLSNFPLRVAPTSILFGSLLAAPLALRVRSARIEAPAAPGRNFWVSLAMFIVLVLGVRWMAASVALRNTLGETGLRNGQLALHYGERLMGLSAGDWKAWEARAASLQLVGQLDPAFDAYQRSLGLNPYSMEALSSMATIRLSQGRPAEGLELAEKSLALTPNYTGTLWTRAICLFQLKRFEESAKQFEVLTAYMPNDPQTHLNLGVCYMNLGRKADAIMVWKRSLQLDPNNEQTKAYLKSVGVKAP